MSAAFGGGPVPNRIKTSVVRTQVNPAVREGHDLKASEHRRGHYERSKLARARQGEAALAGKKAHHEADEQADHDLTSLRLEALERQAGIAEQAVRRTATECADRYGHELAQHAEQQRQAVRDDVGAIKERLTDLRRIEARVTWIAMASQPSGRVKSLAPDLSGIDEALQPARPAPAAAHPAAPPRVRMEGPSRIPRATFTNSGNDIAGHITISGTVNGAGAGAFTPQGQLVGHYEGFTAQLFLGSPETCNGICG